MLATLALPVMAQVEDLRDGEKHTAVLHGMDAAARHARTTRAKALSAPLVQNGMDAVSAFELSWAALAGEAAGKGRAEDILADLQQNTHEEVLAALSVEEFVDLLAALEDEVDATKKAHGVGMHALLHRLGQLLQNEREYQGMGFVSGTVSGGWVQLAQQQEQREGAILPAVWSLVNHSGTILQYEPDFPAFLPPGRPGGSDHDTIIDEIVEEKKKAAPQEELETQTFSLASLTDTQPAARSLGVSLMSFGGGGGGGGGGFAPFRMMMMAAPLADSGSDDVVWDGDLTKLTDGVSATFDKRGQINKGNDYLDVTLDSEWRPYEIIVDDTGVSMTQRGEAYGKIGYAFNGTGSIADDAGHKTTLTKKGSGILVMANAGNSYSGGTDVQGGTIYVADQGVLGTGAVTMHDGTSMWVNYTWNLDYSSSFRNPVVSNSIRLADGASSTISYGDFIYRKVLGNNTSRVWRNLYLTGGISGGEDTRLLLQGYTSRLDNSSSLRFTCAHIGGSVDLRATLWYSGFILNRSVAAEDEKRFYGTLTLGNHVNDSLHKESSVDDRLSNRESGAVKLVLSDDVLEYGTLDATREFAWSNLDSGLGDNNKLLLTGEYSGGKVDVNVSDAVSKAYTDAGGTSSNYGSYGLRQTHSNEILISNNTKVGELKADLLGVTQESYRDAIDWSEALEVKLVRVVTQENSTTLTLGKTGAKADSWFSGMVGFDKQLCDADGDGKDTLTKDDISKPVDGSGTTVAGVSMVKVGNNAQYIHSAKLHNLDVQDGTLGFNNVDLAGNLQLRSGTRLRVGVNDDRWKTAADTTLEIGEWGQNNNHRLTVVTEDAVSMKSPITGETKPVPTAARIEGQLTLHAGTELEFVVENLMQDTGDRKVIIPVGIPKGTDLSTVGTTGINYLKEHSLLQVAGTTGVKDAAGKAADVQGLLTLSQNIAVSLTGVNFLREDYSERTYFLASADKIIVDGENVAEGHASDFASRIVTLGYGFYGIVSSIDGHGHYDNNGTYQTYTGSSYLGQDFLTLKVAADPTRSWTGSTVARGTQGSDKQGAEVDAWLGTANTWKALPGISDYSAYKESDYKDLVDPQWKENGVYTDGVSVKFGNLYLPEKWAEFRKKNPEASLNDFLDALDSSMVTKVDNTAIFSPNGHGNGIAMRNETGDILYGVDGSSYFNEDGTKFVTKDGLSAHYEHVMIDGTVRPGYVTVNSDYTVKTQDGYVTLKDDTNYVFTNVLDAEGKVVRTGCIADATAADMEGIYAGLLGADLDEGVRSDLAHWHTGLAKGGTGALVIETENTYSGGSLLRGGLTVMRNKWALGMADPTLAKTDAAAKGGKIEMAYGAALMVDYIDSAYNAENVIAQGQVTNDLVITHMADFDNSKATGDAQLMNRYDAALVVNNLSSYDDAILTLRGASLAENSFIKKDSKEHAFYSYADYVFTNPVNAYGTIRMAGYLQGGAGRILTDDGSAYQYGGGNVQLTISGHDATEENPKVLWDNTTIDLSLNGGNKNVLAIETRFLHNEDGTVTENDGTRKIKLKLGTLKDDGKSGYNACVINDASSERIGKGNKESYLAILTLDPAADANFSGNVGFGIGQNAEGADMPSRGYISLIKTGAATQSIGNARLLDLTVQDSGLMHVSKALSARSISTTNIGAQHIHVGAVEDAAMSHTLIVGKGGVLSFDTTLNATDPLKNLLTTESSDNYGKELTYVLLKDGATVTGSGNWFTDKGISVMGGAEITFNTHDYSMDQTVTSTMAVYGASAQALKDAFDDSHIFWLKQALSGTGVTLNLVNEQMSVGATEQERGTATANGYFLTRDLNAYENTAKKLQYGLRDGSTVNIGAKTILQSYMSATANSGIEYNITGADAALQFLDADSNKLKLSEKTYGGALGETSYVDKATLSEGGRIILGGAAAATTSTNQNTENVVNKTDITADADVVITNKAGQTASVLNMKTDTVNANGYETILSAANSGRATVANAEMTVKQESSVNNTLVQKTDINTSLVHLQNKCSVTLEDVLVSADSKVEGEGPESGTVGAAAVFQGATAASDQDVLVKLPSFSTGSVTLTDPVTCINTTLTTVANVVKNDVLIQVAKADQLSRTDVGGKGLTLGLTQETLEKATAAGVRYLAIQVSDSGRFLYEQQAVLESVKLTDHNGATYTNPAYEYRVVSSKEVADFIGVDQSEVSNTVIYIEVSETPEPTTATLSLLALAALMARRKRNK
ncbi:MAG: autotransporter-associated beta strand repeat-containing protein [Akkermansia sp.]|nr:autotransporter-associated beta strand repeat-containing protein [Akkermansia sp.]